jgi:hypothetical protein
MDALKYSVEVEQPDEQGCYSWMSVRAGQRSCFSGGVDMLGPFNNIDNLALCRVPMPFPQPNTPLGDDQNVTRAGKPITAPTGLTQVADAFFALDNNPSWLIPDVQESTFWITKPGWYDFKLFVEALFQDITVPSGDVEPGTLDKVLTFNVQRVTDGYPPNEIGVRSNFYNGYQGKLLTPPPSRGGYVCLTSLSNTTKISTNVAYEGNFLNNETSMLWPISEGDIETFGTEATPGAPKGIQFVWQYEVLGTFAPSENVRVSHRTNLQIERKMNYVGPEGEL